MPTGRLSNVSLRTTAWLNPFGPVTTMAAEAPAGRLDTCTTRRPVPAAPASDASPPDDSDPGEQADSTRRTCATAGISIRTGFRSTLGRTAADPHRMSDIEAIGLLVEDDA